MTLYAQSDVHGKAIPVTSGGCGREHRRPVIDGIPGEFALDCPRCEAVLRGDRRPQILKYQIDPQTGRTLNQERVADADPQWSSTPETVPLTEDEKRSDRRFRDTAKLQIDMMNALGTAVGNKLQIPREMEQLLKRALPAETLRALQGAVVCANGHDVEAGKNFCGECGVSMATRGAIAPPEEPEIDLGRLHPQTLRNMCR